MGGWGGGGYPGDNSGFDRMTEMYLRQAAYGRGQEYVAREMHEALRHGERATAEHAAQMAGEFVQQLRVDSLLARDYLRTTHGSAAPPPNSSADPPSSPGPRRPSGDWHTSTERGLPGHARPPTTAQELPNISAVEWPPGSYTFKGRRPASSARAARTRGAQPRNESWVVAPIMVLAIAAIGGVPLLSKIMQPTAQSVLHVTAGICVGVPLLILAGAVFSALCRSALPVGVGIALIPFWIVASAIFLTEPAAELGQVKRWSLAQAATADSTKTHIVLAGFAAMIGVAVVGALASTLIESIRTSGR
jgi:hypothetical protein